jgi:hypothetical protein
MKPPLAFTFALALVAPGCAPPPTTTVVLDNDYSPSATPPLVVYQAYWQSVLFDDGGIPAGASSGALSTVPCSANTAYVVLAPGWTPGSATRPTSFVVLQSRGAGFGVSLGDTLHIPVNDETFLGNCDAGSFLSAEQAQFITQQVFPNDFAAFTYDPATCVATPIADAGADSKPGGGP